MKASELIQQLSDLVEEYGDCELIISDGHDYRFYRESDEAKYLVQYFDGEIEIGVGGCDEE